MLSELSQTDKGKYFMISQVDIKKNFYPLPSQTHRTRDYIVVTGNRRLGEGEGDEGSQKVQTPSLSTGDVRYNMMTIVNTANMLHMKVVKRVNPKFTSQEKIFLFLFLYMK